MSSSLLVFAPVAGFSGIMLAIYPARKIFKTDLETKKMR